MMERRASLSLDLDNLWSYLKVHGDPSWEGFPSYLDLVVPRVLAASRRVFHPYHGLRRRAGRRPGEKSWRPPVPRRSRARDRQSLLPSRTLAAPLLGGRGRRRNRARRSRYRERDRHSPARVSRTRLQRLGNRPERAAKTRLSSMTARRFRPLSVLSRARTISCAPGSTTRRSPSATRCSATCRRRLEAAEALPVGSFRRAAARDPGNHHPRPQDPVPLQLSALAGGLLRTACEAPTSRPLCAAATRPASPHRCSCIRSTSSGGTTCRSSPSSRAWIRRPRRRSTECTGCSPACPGATGCMPWAILPARSPVIPCPFAPRTSVKRGRSRRVACRWRSNDDERLEQSRPRSMRVDSKNKEYRLLTGGE